ncbi:MAG: phage shock protein [Patescibacteria group bacterium]|jgi:phage shock protein PspC (stress-responsive transcriptional regulator)|nr:phage shock protein [Patescibacteria group bacterium]
MAKAVKKLIRPKDGRVIGGVSLGLAQYLNIDVTVIRIIWVLLLIPGGLPGLLPYIILWIAIPSEK